MEYNYLENIKEDVKNYIEENEIEINEENKEEIKEELSDNLFNDDNITGNGSGSYTCSTWKAEENINHNWELLQEALEEFGQEDTNILEKGAEWCDVTIRCYLLSQAIDEVVDERIEENE